MNALTSLASDLAALLRQRGQTVAVAESSAGGLISAALLAQPGASAYFTGGGVIYTGAARGILMGISDAELGDIRSSSEPYAQLLARKIRERLSTSWGLAETGAAGPSGNRYGDSPGHSCIAVAGPVQRVITVESRVARREANMWLFARAALELLEKAIRDAS
jgi:PncC family amidohydrolase